MKAVVFRGIGDIRLEDVREPRIQEDSDAIVRITASAICGTDLHMIRGTLPGMRPGMILGRDEFSRHRVPIALVGKVYCKADAQYEPIEVGDLLTTSPTRGHAMKASDPLQAFGAVIGKALRPLCSGQGLVPVLIALQ